MVSTIHFAHVRQQVRVPPFRPLLGGVPSEWTTPRKRLFVPSDGYDVAFAASVFTHLLEEDSKHYLHQIARVLKPAGRAILSIHIDTVPEVTFSGCEARIDIRPDYFLQMARAAGLALLEQVGELCGQETFIFTKDIH